jgi:hypothetical protein
LSRKFLILIVLALGLGISTALTVALSFAIPNAFSECNGIPPPGGSLGFVPCARVFSITDFLEIYSVALLLVGMPSILFSYRVLKAYDSRA